MKTEESVMFALFAVCAVLVIAAFVAMLVIGIEPVQLAHAAAHLAPTHAAAAG